MDLKFKITGNAFEEGIPVHVAMQALGDVQGIVDKTYLVENGRERLSANDRKSYYLRTTGVSHNCMFAELEIVLDTAQAVLPFVTTVTPELIWRHTKAAFDFMKLVYSATRQGTKPTYDISGENISVHIGDDVHNYHANVIKIGSLSLQSYRDLAALTGEEGIDSIQLADSLEGLEKKTGVGLECGDKEIFDLPSSVSDQPIDIVCELFDYNKFDNQGKSEVSEGQPIAPGRYRFVVLGKQDIREYIQAMLKTQVVLRCLTEQRVDPVGEDRVTCLQVISVRNIA